MCRHARAVWIVAALLVAGCEREPAHDAPAPMPTAAEVAEDLAATDRAWAAAAATTDLVSALAAMFAEDVVMPTPAGTFAEGIAAATAALEVDPLNRTSRATWEPIRVGVSADGQHGFTFGYMTVHRADSTRVPLKYMAYWVQEGDGWKAVAYKRARAGDDLQPVSMPPSLPVQIVLPVHDEATRTRHAESLRAAEQAFSDDAQVIGLGPAFRKWGSPDAVNMGGPSYIVGADSIGQAIGAGSDGPSPVSWRADRVIVASSGDLGITFGRIRRNDPAAADDPGVPFFTIWRRVAPDGPWRYVAE